MFINCFTDLSFFEKLSVSRYFTPLDMKCISHFAMKCMGLPLKKGFIIEPPSFAIWMFGIVRMFFTDKMRERVALYSGVEELHAFVGKVSILPTVLGGDLTDEEMFDWISWQIQLES